MKTAEEILQDVRENEESIRKAIQEREAAMEQHKAAIQQIEAELSTFRALLPREPGRSSPRVGYRPK